MKDELIDELNNRFLDIGFTVEENGFVYLDGICTYIESDCLDSDSVLEVADYIEKLLRDNDLL